ncbi:carboxylesterase family protein [Streptomyces flavofungini]|uniref:Carboxylesterase family protein n=1 Tax=Streptomyces flavofungini TaxID=68200 RepID=A0ABS0X915_9ACTN|nr:carboxylesterase family protein [Streptomyces flavofungini]
MSPVNTASAAASTRSRALSSRRGARSAARRRALAAAHAAHSESGTFTYEFGWRSRALDGQLGAAHAVELPFVFDLVHLPELHGPTTLLGPETPPADLAARMHATWVRFARTGNPGWGPYDNPRRSTMRIDTEWTRSEAGGITESARPRADPRGPGRGHSNRSTSPST